MFTISINQISSKSLLKPMALVIIIQLIMDLYKGKEEVARIEQTDLVHWILTKVEIQMKLDLQKKFGRAANITKGSHGPGKIIIVRSSLD